MKELTISEHFSEIRMRLISISLFFSLAFCCFYHQSNHLTRLLQEPFKRIMPDARFAVLTITEVFFTTLKISSFFAILLTLPFSVWHFWKFVSPGLYARERKWFLILAIPSLTLFYSGCLFSYKILTPFILECLLASTGNEFLCAYSYAAYTDFTIILALAIGLTAQIPLLSAILDITGIIRIESLQGKRRHIIVFSFILGAILSPPDVFSQFITALPIYLLFESGLLFTRLLRKCR